MWPKTVFFTSEVEEIARYLCFNARSIQIGKFPTGGFAVLPYLVPGNPKAVHFPDLAYSPKLWARLKKHESYSLTQEFPKEVIAELCELLSSYKAPESTKLIKEFNDHLDEFISIGTQILDFEKLLPQIKEIKILLTEFGTSGSFSRKQNSDGTWNLYVTARVDFPWQNIFKTLLLDFITLTQSGNSNDVGTVGWYQRNAILKYLMEHTPLRDFLKNETRVVNDPKLSKVSLIFLSKLGYPPEPTLDIQKLGSILTPQEKDLFDMLYASKGVLVTFDQAAEIVWGDEVEEKYSLQALAKLVEGIRKKIKSQGINQDVITTLRRRGYLLTI